MENDASFDEASQPMDIDEPALSKCFCDAPHCRELDLSSKLDALLDPCVIFTSNKQVDKLWTLLAHGHGKREAYIAILNEYRNESHCGLAWPPDYVAYRCRTCSVALTMAICAECFRNGNHEGHDYNMFKSRSGGACDCGFSIMKSNGHCSNHGKNARAPRSNEPVPDSLTCIPRRAMPRILGRLLTSLRRQSTDLTQTNETEIYLDTLTEVANSSAILKNIMIQTMLSEEAYSSHLRIMGNHRDPLAAKEASDSLKVLKRERKRLAAFKVPQRWSKQTINAFCDKKPHRTFLEEMIFWMVAYEFHQKLVCFLLSFLMDDDYKTVFAKLFVNYYPNIAMCLARLAIQNRHQHTYEHLSRRILQVSVQIYNDGELTKRVCEEDLTLHTIIYCIRFMIEGSQSDNIASLLQSNTLCQHHGAHGPKVVNGDSPLLRDRQMASFTEDLLAILNFDHGAKRLLSDKDLLDVWLVITSYFQTMSPYKRELYEHAPYETGPRLSMFMIESEFCLVPIWSILYHLKDQNSVAYTCQLLTSIHTTLATWLHAMSIGPNSKLDAYHMSFHIPLHRMFAATIKHMIYDQNVPEEQVYKLLFENQQVLGSKFGYRSAHGAKVTIKIDDFFRMLLLHPLQALTLYHQTRSGMWTRNGLLTVNQAVTYVHCHFCYSIIDMDMFLLRYCGSRLKPDIFIKSFLQRFYAWHCLSFTCGPIFSDTPSDTLRTHYYFNIQPEQITQLVESCLVTLIQLLTLDNHCNISEREQTRRELITMISVADRSYSHIVDMLPTITEQPRDDEMFESLLKEVTDYKPPSHGAGGNLQQGCYTLKSSIWDEEYNPVHVLYRYYQRRDYQQSIERFFQYAKLKGKLNRRHHSSALWPPLKVPTTKIANFGPIDLSPLVGCPTLLGVVFSIIYKCIYVEEMPDSMMAYTIHLLELCIRKYLEKAKISDEDTMDDDATNQPSKNASFAGRYCYRELISYYENMPRGEAMLKGRTIYSLFTDDQPNMDIEPMSDNIKFFPFVKHALDLAFDTTWFPFESVLDNCLVHIETVHSLPRDEFDVMVQCTASEKNENVESATTYEDSLYAAAAGAASGSSEHTLEQQQEHLPNMSASSSTRSTESQTGDWSNLIGIAMDEVDDIIIDDDVDFIEDADDDEDIGPSDGSSTEGTSSGDDDRFDAVASVRELDDITRAPSESYYTIGEGDQVTRTPSPQTPTSTERIQSQAGEANVEWASQGSSFRVGTSNNNNNNSATVVTTASRSTNATAHGSSTMPSPGSRSVQNWAECVATLERAQRDFDQQEQRALTTPGDRELGSASHEQAQPLQAQNLITERRAILDSEPRPMITNPPHPLALEAATSASATASSRPSSVGSSANASTDATNQELGQRISTLSVPASSGVDVPLISGSCSPSSITRSGAIVPRAFGELASVSEQAQRQPQPQEFPNQPERSLSEVDIQARFMGFFQSDAVSRINSSRIYRIRQTARRGNYRGAYLTEPYHAHNNQNTQQNTTAITNNNFGGTGTPLASTNNNNTTNTNNNNNNNNNNPATITTNPEDGAVQELVRRSVAVVPAITDAVRATARATMSLAIAPGDEFVRRRASIIRARREAVQNRTVALLNDAARRHPSAGAVVPLPPLAVPSTQPQVATRAGVNEQSTAPMAHRRQTARRGGPYTMMNRFFSTRLRPQQQPSQSQSQSQQQHQQGLQDARNSRRLRKEYRQHHGESILTLLLRLHAKYSQQPRSYQFEEERAKTNAISRGNCRIGDGSHFVSIALDLICASDVERMRPRIEHLTDLIWPKPAGERAASAATACATGNETGVKLEMKGSRGEKRFDCDAGRDESTPTAHEGDDTELDIKIEPSGGATAAAATTDVDGPSLAPTWGFGLNLSGSSRADLNNSPSHIGGGAAAAATASTMASLTPEERRRRARERQNRLMAEFANKQRAFMEFAAATSGPSTSASGSAAAAGAATISRSGTTIASTSPRAHSQPAGGSPQKYSNLTLQSDDKTSARGGAQQQFNDEQPINLSSKSNEISAQATSASTSGTTDNNGDQRSSDGDRLSGCDSNRAAAHPVRSSSPVVDAKFNDKRAEPGGSGRDQQQQQQQQEVQVRQGPGTDEDCEMSGQQAECCICGVEGSTDLTNPLGQVVLLQSTSVVGHSHLRPRNDRQLPLEESESIALKEETYAKYLERRIDLLCDHFTEASWLDAINIGAEGGVHVQSCGHYLHIECHQSYIRSLDQEDRLRARTESDEFQCPVCRQLANSVLPVLDDDFFCDTSAAARAHQQSSSTSQRLPTSSARGVGCNIPLDAGQTPSSSSSSPAPASSGARSRGEQILDDQIAQVALQLRDRQAPYQRELQSSAAFCSHLTKATGPQYRLVRTQASMHSLFLFLASIARTNLEAGIIVQATRRRATTSQLCQSTPTGVGAGSSSVPDKQSVHQMEDDRQQQQQQQQQSRSESDPRGDGAAACHSRPATKQDDSDAQRRTCFQLLFHVLALNAQTLINDQWFTYDQIWSHLTHCTDEKNRLGLQLKGNDVPLLLRDPIAMLLQFLFTVSGNRVASGCGNHAAQRPRAIFTCLVKILFNLTVIQSVALVLSYVGPGASTGSLESAGPSPSCLLTSTSTYKSQPCQDDPREEQEKERKESAADKIDYEEHHSVQVLTSCKRNKPATTSESNQTARDTNQAICNLLSAVWTSLSPLLAPNSEQPLMNSVVRSCWPRFASTAAAPTGPSEFETGTLFIENRVKLACLPFLRAAAFLQEHLYACPSPTLDWDLDENCLAERVSTVDKDFTRLVECLELATTRDPESEQTISLDATLNWPRQSDRNTLIASWSSELLRFAHEFSIAARTLLVCRPLGWHRPALMQLPHAFDDIFMFYYQRKCSLCNQVPKDVAVCLVCGAPICLRNSCCKDRSRSRQVHSQHCGANTAVFLAVHTSAIVVIRGSRACVWGFVYLDAHDEEDNGLQRGRPLYLVPARFALLETQWLTHSFDHTCGKRWIYLQDNQ